MGRRAARLALPLGVGGLLLAACQVSTDGEDAAGEDYPGKTIDVVLGNAPGASTDINTRAISPCLEEELGQTVVVQNRDGASGAVANREIIHSSPDGYTLGLNPLTYLTLSPLLDDLGFSIDDVTPIGEVWHSSQVLVARSDAPFSTGKELLEEVEARPGEITVATPGPTSPKVFTLDVLRDEYDLETKVVPLEGESDQHRALIAGDVDVIAVEAAEGVKPFLKNGRYVPLVAMGDERIASLPDVPTLGELGYPDAAIPDNEWGLYGPAGLPDDVVERLGSALESCLEQDEVATMIGKEYVSLPFRGQGEMSDSLSEASDYFKQTLDK